MKFLRPYDYQLQMLADISDELAKPSERFLLTDKGNRIIFGKSLMVQMPTGTGKTFVMAAVIRHINVDGCIWIIAHRRELVEQMKDTLARLGIEYKDGKDIDGLSRAKVRVMSVQWLTRNIKKIKDKEKPGLIIIDEAHHSIAPTYQAMWTAFPQALKLGFTATPCRLKAARFDELYDTLLTSWSIRRFIESGRLSLYDYVVINKDSEDQRAIDSLEKRDAGGDYSTSEMDKKLNSNLTIMRLFRSVEMFAHGKKGIVYAININHAKHIAEYYTRHGLNVVAIDSKTPAAERERMVNDFKAGRIDCLVNVNLFDEGFDCPDVEYIQMARPTLSLAKYLQMVGRGLRMYPDKKLCVLIDNAGLYRMFGLPDADRDWNFTFHGGGAGQGSLDRNRKKNFRIVNNDMEVIVSHSMTLPKTKDEELRFIKNIEPYEKDGHWGLRSDNKIVLQPIYRLIEPFVGNYSAYSISDGRWGVMNRQGKVIISPEYKRVQMLSDDTAILMVNDITTRKVDLIAAEEEEKIRCECWKRYDRVHEALTQKRMKIKNVMKEMR